jgi:hypothetical protein
LETHTTAALLIERDPKVSKKNKRRVKIKSNLMQNLSIVIPINPTFELKQISTIFYGG